MQAMQIREIVDFLETIAPAASALDWDNPGLLVEAGGPDTDGVLVTLDITPAAVEAAEKAGMGLIVSHHPVIFSPLRRLEAGSVPLQLARAGITAFAAHTNLDKAAGGVNDRLAEVLGLRAVVAAEDGLCRIGELPEAMPAAAFADRAAAALGTTVRFRGDGPVRRVGVCGGAGGSELPGLLGQIDAFVTGEMKHHEWLAAAQAGVAVVDAGHYATEVPIVDVLAQRLREAFPGLQVTAFRDAAPYETRM